MTRARRVGLISTGGTIGCRREPQTGAWVPTLEAGGLLAGLGPLGLEIAHRAYASVFGTALGTRELFEIALSARDLLEDSATSGVVVTAGTGIIEEGAFLCELLNTSGKPIVWTGAQYPADAADSDGPRNLRNALRVAASEQAAACGARALVCFNQEVYAARDAIKHHTSSVAAFATYGRGLLARADEDRIVWQRVVPAGECFAAEELVHHVDLIKLVAGSDERFFRASLQSGARAIVVEGFPGVGMVCPGVVDVIHEALAQGVYIVLGTRSPAGRTQAKYGGPFGGATLVERGALLGGDLSPAKLRLMMMVLLAHASTPDQLRRSAARLCDLE